eukprot:1158281-Pelagomonas_calceolata.AAC.5
MLPPTVRAMLWCPPAAMAVILFSGASADGSKRVIFWAVIMVRGFSWGKGTQMSSSTSHDLVPSWDDCPMKLQDKGF